MTAYNFYGKHGTFQERVECESLQDAVKHAFNLCELWDYRVRVVECEGEHVATVQTCGEVDYF